MKNDELTDILKRILKRNGTLPCWYGTEASSPFVVPDALPWLAEAQGDDFDKLASFLARLMRKTRPSEWTGLYAEFRYGRMRPDTVTRLRQARPDDAVELLGAATLSGDGYMREAALRELGVLGHPRAVPYTLLRLSDWVPQVRNTAVTTLRRLMWVGIAEQLLEHYYLVTRLRYVERLDLSAVVNEISDYLRSIEARSAVERALLSEHEPLRVFAYQLLGDQWDERLAAKALSDRAPSIRLWLARTFLASSPPDAHVLFPRLLRDKSSRVSRIMINALRPEQIATHRQQLLDLVFSDARPVREAARYVLQKTSQPDLLAEARRRFAESDPASVSAGVIAGLGELGSAEDCAAVLRLMGSRRSRVREAAVKAVARLGGESATARVVALIDDPSGRVRRAASWAVTRSAWQSWVPVVRRVLLEGSEGGQAQALQILARQSGWDSVPDLLRGLLSAHAKIRDRAWQRISGWQRLYGTKGWIRPSRETVNDLAELWSQVAQPALEVPSWVGTSWSEFRRAVTAELGTAGGPG